MSGHVRLRREARNTDRGRGESGLPGRSHGGWAVSIADIDAGLEHRRDYRTDLVDNDRDKVEIFTSSHKSMSTARRSTDTT
jgi:hypothetical protein